MLYRASVFLLSLAYVICSRSCMAPSTEYPPSAHPVVLSFISVPLILLDPAEGKTCDEHGCSTALAGHKPFRRWPRPHCTMCHASCTAWLAAALSPSPLCIHEQPPLGNACQRSRSPVNGQCQTCRCPFGVCRLFLLLFADSWG